MQTDFQTIVQQFTQFLMPEGVLTLFACAALVLDVMLPRNRKKVVSYVCLAGIALAFGSLWVLYSNIVSKGAAHTAFFDMIVLDSYAVVFKSMFLIGAALAILLSMKYLDLEGVQAVMLYPLNALVEDQLMRLRLALDSLTARDWLNVNRSRNLIYFGRYTGRTPIPGRGDNARLRAELRRHRPDH